MINEKRIRSIERKAEEQGITGEEDVVLIHMDFLSRAEGEDVRDKYKDREFDGDFLVVRGHGLIKKYD